MQDIFDQINRELKYLTEDEALEEKILKQYSLKFHSMEMREGYHIDTVFCSPDLKLLEEYENILNAKRTN